MARMQAHHRRRMIVVAARLVANDAHVSDVSFQAVADACTAPTSPATVRHYFQYLSDLQIEACGDDPALLEQARQLGLIE